MSQRIGSWGSRSTCETTRSAHKVGFTREKGKAAPRDRQGAQKIGSSLSFTKVIFLFGPFCLGGKSGAGVQWSFWHMSVRTQSVEEGSQESGMEWSFNISLQEHIHSPVKVSCLSPMWHFWGIPRESWLVKPYVPLQDVGLTMLSWGSGHWLIFVFWFPRSNNSNCSILHSNQVYWGLQFLMFYIFFNFLNILL
jgi:hypothetical protein